MPYAPGCGLLSGRTLRASDWGDQTGVPSTGDASCGAPGAVRGGQKIRLYRLDTAHAICCVCIRRRDSREVWGRINLGCEESNRDVKLFVVAADELLSVAGSFGGKRSRPARHSWRCGTGPCGRPGQNSLKAAHMNLTLMAQGVLDLVPDRPFSVMPSNFGDRSVHIPKAYGSRAGPTSAHSYPDPRRVGRFRGRS